MYIPYRTVLRACLLVHTATSPRSFAFSTAHILMDPEAGTSSKLLKEPLLGTRFAHLQRFARARGFEPARAAPSEAKESVDTSFKSPWADGSTYIEGVDRTTGQIFRVYRARWHLLAILCVNTVSALCVTALRPR